MIKHTTHFMLPSMAVALALVFAPGALDAQESEPKARGLACSAAVTPSTVKAGKAAVGIIASLPMEIGKVTDVEAPEKSHLRLATAEELEKVDVPARTGEDGKQRPIEMVDDGNAATVWLNTANVEPGAHKITLKGENGTCAAKIEIKDAGER